VSELKALHIMCKLDTESVKVAPESAQNNRGKSPRYALNREGFSPGEVFAGRGLPRGEVVSGGLSSYAADDEMFIECGIRGILMRFFNTAYNPFPFPFRRSLSVAHGAA